jgi:uncharacterized membrane protein (DUF2068 family)
MAGGLKQLSAGGVIRGVTGVGLGLSGAWNRYLAQVAPAKAQATPGKAQQP